ncbi:MAG: hypothetical protein KC561_01260 [Myxococcales bacterium]|nr:hypothetical protein [Myxococcales bacterium]
MTRFATPPVNAPSVFDRPSQEAKRHQARGQLESQLASLGITEQLAQIQPRPSQFALSSAPHGPISPDSAPAAAVQLKERGRTSSKAENEKLGGTPKSPAVAFDNVSLSFGLGPNQTLKSGFKYNIYTQPGPRTNVTIQVTSQNLTITFGPAIRFDVLWPIGDVLVSGIRYSFKKGEVDWVGTSEVKGNGLKSGVDRVVDGIKQFVHNQLFVATRLRAGNWDPTKEKDFPGLIAKVRRNLAATATAKQPGNSSIDHDLGSDTLVKTALTLSSGFKKVAGSFEVIVQPGASVNINTPLGSVASLGTKAPRIDWVRLGCRVEIRRAGKRSLTLTEVLLKHGGQVEVTGYEVHDRLVKDIRTGERLARFLAPIFFGGPQGRLRAVRDRRNLEAKVSKAIEQKVLQTEIKKAISQALSAARGRTGPIDLGKALGFE